MSFCGVVGAVVVVVVVVVVVLLGTRGTYSFYHVLDEGLRSMLRLCSTDFKKIEPSSSLLFILFSCRQFVE